MTNRQWLLEQMQNMSDEELAEMLASESNICDMINKECVNETCTNCTLNWLKAEHKEPIKISDAEKVILENIPKVFKYIARDKCYGKLMVYVDKPYKTDDMWERPDYGDRGYEELTVFNHLFQFIKWSDIEPYEIAELLKGE